MGRRGWGEAVWVCVCVCSVCTWGIVCLSWWPTLPVVSYIQTRTYMHIYNHTHKPVGGGVDELKGALELAVEARVGARPVLQPGRRGEEHLFVLFVEVGDVCVCVPWARLGVGVVCLLCAGLGCDGTGCGMRGYEPRAC